jgi:biopolymer transport protein TolR
MITRNTKTICAVPCGSMPKRVRRHTCKEGIQMTPMIDVMATLLAVFMVTAPMMTSGIDLELPAAGQSVSATSDYAMVLSVNREGNYYLSEDRLELDAIIRRLVAMRAENPRLTVMIAGDERADYGAVMRAMGALRDSGFEAVSLQTRLEGSR